MDKAKKKTIKRIISLCCAAAVVAFLAVMPLLADTGETEDGPQASILSGTVEKQTIESQLIGGGTLAEETAVSVEIPSAVKLTAFLVANGDAVSEGDPIATVDRVSVMSAITQVQETLEYLAEEIEDASSEENSSTVTAQAGGTVKLLYAEKGDRVQDVMLEHGALAVLSLDGMMAVEINRNSDVAVGDDVSIKLSDDTEVTGQVESNLDGVIVVTVSDDGYGVGESVTVYTDDGDRLGSGELYIHSPWNAVAYSGTVSAVSVSEEKTVSAGGTLFTLKDTGSTAAYQQLSNQHREYEELMLQLFQMYQSQTVNAPCDGVVSGVDEDSVQLLSAENTGWTVTFLSNAPAGEEETAYHNYVGQVSAVGTDGLVMNLNPQDLDITDYQDLSGLPLDPAAMTESVIYNADAPIYELTDGVWQQIDADQIGAGDILLFAGDEEGNFVWVVRVSSAASDPQPSEPEEPSEQPEETEPTVPEESVTPSEPSDDTSLPEQSGSTGQQSSQYPQSGSSISGSISGGFSQGSQQTESAFELYGLEMAEIAAVTAQDTMTLEISVDELDISKVFVGQTARITVDALSGESFEGTVTEIGNTGTSSGGNSKFTVSLTMARGENMLAGMNASAFITLDTAAEVTAIPVAALEESGAETVVYTGYNEEKNELTDPVAVTLGCSDGEYAEVLEGLSEGQTYYYAYYDTLVISNVPDAGTSFSFFGR